MEEGKGHSQWSLLVESWVSKVLPPSHDVSS